MSLQPKSSRFLLLALIPLCLVGTSAMAQDEAPPPRHLRPVAHGPRIVNGLPTAAYPTTVAILSKDFGLSFCTGTLVGCRTVVTAAHCVCGGDGVDCQDSGSALIDPSEIEVFVQSGGLFDVASITVPEKFVFGVRDDVAVLELAGFVEGVPRTRLNTQVDPTETSALEGTIVGYGLTEGGLTDSGVKRYGDILTTPCLTVPNDGRHLCWDFTEPLGPPGEDANTCLGDSGGPLFMNFGQGDVLAGITSGGDSVSCDPPDEAFDTNVWLVSSFIKKVAGSDLDAEMCGGLPDAGSEDAEIWTGDGSLDGADPERDFMFEVPDDARLLRVTLNGEDGADFQPNDMDVFIQQGSPATRAEFDCSSERSGSFEICEIHDPVPGTWYVLANLFEGTGGDFQVTATIYRSGESLSSCAPSETTLCIDDQPGDRRFRLRTSYVSSVNGGISGDGQAISLSTLGIRRGGLFWFFNRANPEVLIKVLNGCRNNGFYWIFWSAGTNLGLEITVVDTFTGEVRKYLNKDGVTAPPVSDVRGFECN